MGRHWVSHLLVMGTLMVGLQTAAAETGPLGWGVAEWQQELQTDRPDFTEGTQTVQSGHMQIEGGYTFTYNKDDGETTQSHQTPEMLARLGLHEGFELRIAWAGYQHERHEAEFNRQTQQGVSDISVGGKQHISQPYSFLPEISAIAEISIPVGSSEVSSDTVEPGAKLLWSYDRLGVFALGGNLNGAVRDSSGNRYLEVASSIALGYGLTQSLGTYLEYFGTYPTESTLSESTTHYLNTGLTWGLTEHVQCDIRIGAGLNGAADDFFSGIGFAVRV